MKRSLRWLVAVAVAASAGTAFGQAQDIKIAHVYDKTGPLEAYAKQTHIGFMMGLEYATGGKMESLGRKIVVIEKDDADQARRRQGRSSPQPTATTRSTSRSARRSRAWRSRCCRSPRSTRRSCSSSRRWPTRSPATSGTATSSAPAATPRRTRVANAVALGKPNAHIATLAQDYAFGRDGVKAVQGGARRHRRARSCTRSTRRRRPPTSPRRPQRIFDALKDKKGRKIIFVIWAGAATRSPSSPTSSPSASASRSPPAATSCRR